MSEYTDTERQMALDIYRTQGASAASKAIGCSRQTVYDWLADSLSTDTDKQKAQEDAISRRIVLREHARTRMVYTYLRLIDRCTESMKIITKEGVELELAEPSAESAQKFATAAAILIDKLRLEMGESTGRTEHVSLGLVEAEIQKLEAELGNVAPSNT